MAAHVRFVPGMLVLAAGAALLAGCSNGEMASELPPRLRPRVIKAPEQRSIRIPADEPFSIALSSAQKKAGIGGQAEANGVAAKEGSAEAMASVTHGGEATATFQLGHSFRNETERQMDLDFTLRFKYAIKAEATSEPGLEATLALNLYARDARNILVRQDSLVEHSSRRGPMSREGDDGVQFTHTLGPGDTFSVFLGGQAVVRGEYERSGATSLRVSDVALEAAVRPAPATETR